MIRNADVLVIVDSCFPTAAASGTGNNEYLAASAFRPPASGSVERRFTRRFLDLLASIDYAEITVAQIHAKLITQANRPKSELNYTPVHIASIDKP